MSLRAATIRRKRSYPYPDFVIYFTGTGPAPAGFHDAILDDIAEQAAQWERRGVTVTLDFGPDSDAPSDGRVQ
jgi:hypothetical protein